MGKTIISLALLITFSGLLFMPGCYHLVGSGSSEVSKDIKNLAIPIFKNKTDVAGIEMIVTDAVIKEFTSFSPGKITDIEHAKAVIEGKITSYSLETIAADKRDKVLEYRLRVRLEIALKDIEENNILYENKNFEGHIDFKVPKDSISRKRGEENACQRLAEELSKRLVGEIFEGF